VTDVTPARPRSSWYGKGLARVAILLAAAALVAGLAAAYGMARDHGYLQAAILTGSPDGSYHALATRLGERARRGHGTLTAVSTAGSIENVARLGRNGRCDEMFAMIQDGTPVAAEAGIELLGRLPAPESLLLLARADNRFVRLPDLAGARIGIGPEGSGTAHLMRHLFEDSDLKQLGVRLSHHDLPEQAALVAQGRLDLAAFVMQEDAPFLRDVMGRHGLDIAALDDLEGLTARYPWLTLGTIAAGRYDLVRPIPAKPRQVARLATLVVASPCARRADRIALLVLLAAELPGFVRSNPPSATSAATVVPLAEEARQFFVAGEPGFADRYFPWLVNLLSPAYWVYLVMAATVLFNGMTAYSRFQLWRIDVARERLEATLKQLVDPEMTHAQMREALPATLAAERQAAAHSLRAQFVALRARCQRCTDSLFTPMGEEMFYRYQQSLIDDAITTLGALLGRSGRDSRTA
jgi:TRAP-type uncharacterized transport system substrate-binding protein